MSAVKTRDPEFSYEEGDPIAVHLPGHDYGDVEALTLAAQFWLDEEATWDDDDPALPEDGFEPPRKVWLRVIPWNDSGSGLAMMHHYQNHPGVGARPVTLVREARRMVACRACGAPATTGLDYDGGHYLYAFHPADRDRHGRVWLCRGCEAEISQHQSAIYAQVHQPCPDCGHSLGRHERYGKGPATPCGFASDPDCGCPCTHPSPHSAVLDFDDLRSIPSLRETHDVTPRAEQ